MINHITLIKGSNKVTYHVFYNSGRKVTYTEKDNIPDTVLKFICDECRKTETKITETGTATYFR